MSDVLQPNDILEVRFFCKANQQFSVNVRHFRVSPGIVGLCDTNMAVLAFAAHFAPLYKAVLSSAAQYYGTGVRRLAPAMSLEVASIVAQGAGTVAGDLIPSQTAGLLSLRTDLPGRRFRGRAYIPFGSETDNGPTGNPSAAYQANLNVIGQSFVTEQTYTNGVNNFKAKGVVWHRDTLTDTTLSGSFTAVSWATQRRRSQVGRPDRAPF